MQDKNIKLALRTAIVLAVPVISSQPVQAAEEELFFGELPIVASVSRLPQKISETPAAVTVIDQEMIRASGMRTVEDLLRLVPGFQVTSHNQDPGVVTYHGLNTGLGGDEYGPRVQVLIDGRSQYSPLFKSGVNWNLLPVILENIDRIEVTRGSNSVSYGSNAFMGVINIITLDPAQTEGWLLAANHGNNGIRDETLRWSGRTNNADIRFSSHRQQDEGYQRGFYSNRWTYAPDSRRSQLLDLRVDLRLTDRDELQLTASQADDSSLYGRPGSPVSDPLRYFEQRSRALGAQWRRVISATEEIKLRYAYVEDFATSPYLQRTSFDLVSPNGANVTFTQPFDAGGKSRTHELEFTHNLAPSDKTRMMWGGAAKSIALNSPAQFTSVDWKNRSNLRAFGNLEYRPASALIFNLGASLEHDSRSGNTLDPRASLSYHLTPAQTVRLIASRAHRSPSLYEMQGRVDKQSTYNGSPVHDFTYLAQGVRPEQIDTLEIGYLGEFKAIRSSIDVRVFSEHIPNRIQIVPLALPASLADDRDRNTDRLNVLNNALYPYGRADGSINMENVRIQGYEYQWRWQPFDNTRLIYNNALVSIDAEFTNQAAIADFAGPNTEKIIQQTRQSAPTRSQSAMLIQKLPYALQASVMYFRNSPMRWRRNGELIQASERIDWRLAKQFRLGESLAEVAYTVQMANEPQEGRQPARIANQLQWMTLRLTF